MKINIPFHRAPLLIIGALLTSCATPAPAPTPAPVAVVAPAPVAPAAVIDPTTRDGRMAAALQDYASGKAPADAEVVSKPTAKKKVTEKK